MKKLLLIICVFYTANSIAQIKTLQTPIPDDSLKLFHQQFQKINFTPLSNAALSGIVSNIALSSTLNEGEKGRIDLKYAFKKWLTGGFFVEQQLGKDDKQASFYDFTSGISPGTSAGFNLQYIFWSARASTSSFERFTNIANKYARRHGVDRRTVTYNDIIQNGTGGEIAEVEHVKLRNPIFFNFKASFTKTNFAFATDSVKLKTSEQNYITPNVGLSVGFPSISLKSYFAIVYTYSESYNAADELTFSSPFGTTKNTFSQTLAFGSPIKKTDHKITAEFRQSYGTNPANFAIDPSITYGFATKQMALSLPFYFIKGVTSEGKATGLQGGVNLGYLTGTDSLRSFKDGFGAQIVLSVPFDVFGNL